VPEPSPATCASATSFSTGDPAIDALQGQFRPVLEANRRSFEGRTGQVEGFGAGAVYPQVWLRDSATLIPATRYLEPRAALTSWIEEHLSHQMADGALWDWVAAGEASAFVANAPRARVVYREGSVVLTADKNTTAADQETSAVDAAYRVYRLTGDREWLSRPVAGIPLIDRLDSALSYLVAERVDPAAGLVASALTADWGDVSPAYSDQNAIYLDGRTPVAVGLYANVMLVRAARALAEMFDSVGDVSRAEHWRGTAAAISDRIDTLLWDEPRGFYRMHLVLDPAGMPFDDSDIFALGGNAMAALHGVADARRAARVFGVARERSRALGLPSAGPVLIPPYPTGFFSHPLLRQAYTYQNGGVWDWWSARLVLAMFERGYSEAALEDLGEAAGRLTRSGGLYEWYSLDGVGQGSASYAGNVGALAGAVFEGLFGIDLTASGLDLTVRLGGRSGRVSVCEPATGHEVAYSYDFDPGMGRATLQLESNAPGTGRLAIRLPAGAGDAAEVFVDAQPVMATRERLGDDDLVWWTTTWGRQQVEVELR